MPDLVLVLAQGNGRRWNGHLGIPKHLVNVEGETVLGRAVRLFSERGCEVVVLGPDDDRYRIEGSTLVTLPRPTPTGRESVDKFLGTKELWSADGRTTIVWGDCFYTDAAATMIAAHDGPGIHYFRRTGPSRITGHRWDESFAVTFTADAHRDVVAACERVLRELPAHRNDHIFHHYAAHLGLDRIDNVSAVVNTPGQTVIDDFTDDFDHPEDYWRWLERRDARLPVSCVVMAHPSRSGWATDLAIELDCEVVWDRGRGLWDTARRCLEAADPSASHHLVVQDDAIPAPDLLEGLSKALAVPGNRPVGLYAGRSRNRYGGPIIELIERAAHEGSSWAVAPGPKWAVAVAHPVALIEQMLAIADEDHRPADDTRFTAAYQALGVDCWYTVPSLVDHREGLSIVRGSEGRGRTARRFDGTSALDVDWFTPPVDPKAEIRVPQMFESAYPKLVVRCPDGRFVKFRDGRYLARDRAVAEHLALRVEKVEAVR